MLYVLFVANRPVSATTEYPKEINGGFNTNYQNRNDWKSLDEVRTIAAQLTEYTNLPYVAVDNGGNVSPRFDIIETPKVGDKVSRAFNGDYYPAGVIAKVSSSLKRIETTDGTVFYRRRESASWVSAGTWSMVDGHESRLNPSF